MPVNVTTVTQKTQNFYMNRRLLAIRKRKKIIYSSISKYVCDKYGKSDIASIRMNA